MDDDHGDRHPARRGAPPRRLRVPGRPHRRQAARISRLGLVDAEAPAGPRSDAGVLRHEYANVHRGVYRLAERATEGYEEARRTVSAFVNASSEREIVFTRSATESINLVAYAWGLQNLGPGDTVLITELEHHANFVPWQFIASRTGASFRHIPIDDAGELQLDALDELARDNSIKVVGVGLVSNSLGTINPVRGSPRGRTTRARSSSSTRPRRRRTGGSTCRRSAATSSRCRRTSCAARAGSGLSGAVRRSSSPWPRSTSAAR